MSKKVFIVSSSPRKNGNSDLLAEQFARGAREAGNEVVKIDVKDIGLKFCSGCMSCLKTGKCALNDGINAILDEVQNSDVLVFATPIYYYGMSGQLKTFLDRLNPLYSKNNRFKNVYLLATAAENDESACDGALNGIECWAACFPGVKIAGAVRGVGADKAGEIRDNPAFFEAYEVGKSI